MRAEKWTWICRLLTGMALLLPAGCVYRLGGAAGTTVGVGLLNPEPERACFANVVYSDEVRQSVWFHGGTATLAIPHFKGCSVYLGPVCVTRRSQETEVSVLICEGRNVVKRIRLDALHRCPRDFAGHYMVDVK